MNESLTCYAILQNFGLEGGGWGPASLGAVTGDRVTPIGPAIYTGENPLAIEMLKEAAREIHKATGLATKLVRYEQRVDIVSYEAKRKEQEQ